MKKVNKNFDLEKQPLTKKEVMQYFPKYKMTQFGMLDQKLLSEMTYQSHLGLRYSDKKKDALMKKFNRRIIRNYILFTILGGLIVGGVVYIPKVIENVKSEVIEKTLDNGR